MQTILQVGSHKNGFWQGSVHVQRERRPVSRLHQQCCTRYRSSLVCWKEKQTFPWSASGTQSPEDCRGRLQAASCTEHKLTVPSWQSGNIRRAPDKVAAWDPWCVLLRQLGFWGQRPGLETGTNGHWAQRCDHIGSVKHSVWYSRVLE